MFTCHTFVFIMSCMFTCLTVVFMMSCMFICLTVGIIESSPFSDTSCLLIYLINWQYICGKRLKPLTIKYLLAIVFIMSCLFT